MAMKRTPLARFALCALFGATLAGGRPLLVHAAETISEQDAHSIGVAAYLYFYPLVTMDLTRKQLTNVAKAEGIDAPMNTFANVPAFPSADMKVVVRPNFDTLYSSAWLDLTKEPMIVSVPDTQGRYYLLPMLDMWTDVFASPGWRTTGTQAGDYAVVPPGWSGSTAGGRGSHRRAHALCLDHRPHQDRWAAPTTTPCTRSRPATRSRRSRAWGKAAEPVVGTVDPGVDMKTPPKIAGRHDAGRQVLRLRRRNPQAAAAAHHRSTDPRPDAADRDRARQELRYRQGSIRRSRPALETAPEDALKLMAWKVSSLARVVNGWSMNTDTMGVYGNYYLKRAIVTQLGLGANLPEDAIYPLNLADETGKPLDGANRLCPPFRQGRHAAGERLLVGHAL